MTLASQPSEESERLRALERLDILDTPPEREFDALVKAAALVCEVPISLISLVDAERQWFKANWGLQGTTETARSISFCSRAIEGNGLFQVQDATADPRFVDNPLVTEAPGIRFYAGFPLRLSDGQQVGTLCVIDNKPKQLTPTQQAILSHLSTTVVQALESRRMARGFLASEARFRALSDGSPLGVFATDTDGACTYTNDRWQAMFGLPHDQAKGHGWSKALHPQDKQAVFEEWQRTAELERDFDMQFRVQHQNGTILTVRALARMIKEENGSILGFVGSVEDITDREIVQQALADERRRLEAIIEGTGAGTWEWNVQTGETRYNEHWAEIVGMSLEELGPASVSTWNDLTHPDDLATSTEKLNKHFNGETAAYECEARMKHRDGSWIWILDRGRVLTRTSSGEPEWMFGTHVDITARKVQENALRESESLLSRAGELAKVGGWQLEFSDNTVSWSEQTRRIHGVADDYEPELVDAIEFYPPEAQPIIREAIEHAREKGQSWDLVLPFVQASGKRIWIRAAGQAEFDDGKPVRLLGTFQDITERVVQRHALEDAHRRIKLATTGSGIGIWEFDLQRGTMEMDAQMRRLYAIPEGVSEGLSEWWSLRLHEQDGSRVMSAMKKAIDNGSAYDDEFRLKLPGGAIRHLRASAQVVNDENSQAHKLVGVNWDVTSLRELSEELAGQHELLHVTLESIGDAVITTDAASQVTWMNPAAERMTGWQNSAALARPLTQVFNIVNEETRQPAQNPVDTCLAEGKIVGLASNTLLIGRDGTEYGIEDSAAPIRNASGHVLGVVLVFHDVTEQRRLSGEMTYRATHDTLTGLINRGEFESRLRRTLKKAQEEGGEHSLMYIDLDQFKLVNDACGHSIGDKLLAQVASLLGENIRSHDILARVGGDEFAVLLEHCAADKAQQLATQICESMEDFRFAHGDRRFRIGTSIGLVLVDRRWTDIEALLLAADTACYAAKEEGRNRVHQWFDTDQVTRARQGEMQWATRLEQALDEDRFVLHAQRIAPLHDEAATEIHAEVLLRLLEDDGSLTQPGAFLPAAERFHLAPRIDRWVLRRAVLNLASMSDSNPIHSLSINLSGQSVGDREFHRDAIELLENAGPNVCQRICLEITETAAITAIADAAVFVEQVRKLGVRVALDDFGAGASSFGYLKTLKIDLIKIDGQFIRDLIGDPLDAATVRCFVDIAQVLGVQTVAEFVDRPELVTRVRELGIDFAQGFWIHEPEPLENLLGPASTARLLAD